MPSTYSPNLRLELQATGENRSTWGIKANTVFNLVEDAVSGFVSVPMADANVTLTALNGSEDQSRNAMVNFTGANTAIRTATIPAVPKSYIMRNATTGGFAVTVSNGVNTISLTNGDWVLVWTDGTSVFIAPLISQNVTITNTDAGASPGPVLTLYRNSASPAASDIIGQIRFDGEDTVGNQQFYADIFATILDATSGTEDSQITIRNTVAGVVTTQALINSTGWNNMNIGATTPGTGAFTTLSTTGIMTAERFVAASGGNAIFGGDAATDTVLIRPDAVSATNQITLSGSTGLTTLPGILDINGAEVTIGTTSAVVATGSAAGAVRLRPNGPASAVGELVVETTITSLQSGAFGAQGASLVLYATGAGAVRLRPNGSGSAVGEFLVQTSGAAINNGTMTAERFIAASGGSAIFGGDASTDDVLLRPDATSATNQTVIDGATGNMAVGGDISGVAGTFSGAVSMAGLTATTGTFSSSITATAIDVSVDIETPILTLEGANGIINWEDETNMWIRRLSAGVMQFVTAGIQRGQFDTGGLDVNGAISASSTITSTTTGFRAPAGVSTYSWTADTNTGIDNFAADSIGLNTNGIRRLSLSNTAAAINLDTTINGTLTVTG